MRGRKKGQSQRRGCEDGSRGWSDAAMSQGMWAALEAAKGWEGIFP